MKKDFHFICFDYNTKKNKPFAVYSIENKTVDNYSLKELKSLERNSWIYGVEISDDKFKLEPKEAKGWADFCDAEIPNLEEHLSHMKTVKKGLKSTGSIKFGSCTDSELIEEIKRRGYSVDSQKDDFTIGNV